MSGAQNLPGLSGSYAFEFSGYNSTGFVAFAGTFTANGAGGITAGEEDYNSISGSDVTYTNLVGTYTLGSDGRGTFTFTGSTPAQPSPQFTYAFSIDAIGNGRFIEFDSSGTRGSGKIELQTVSTCVVGHVATTYDGYFAFGGGSRDFPPPRYRTPRVRRKIHSYTADCSFNQGSLSFGEMDTNMPGVVTIHDTSVSGIYQSGPDTSHCTIAITSAALEVRTTASIRSRAAKRS